MRGRAITLVHGGTSKRYPYLVGLKKFQTDELFAVMAAEGLTFFECNLDISEAESRITHSPSGSYFEVRKGFFAEDTITLRVVAKGTRSEIVARRWSNILEWARKWAQEVSAPDLWTDLRHSQASLVGPQYDDLENTPFTYDEQKEIAAQLIQIKEAIKKTYSLSSEQMSRVEARLDEAEAASRRIGRKDWLLLFGGTLFTVMVTDLISPDIVQHILSMAIHGLGHLFGGNGNSLPVPSHK